MQSSQPLWILNQSPLQSLSNLKWHQKISLPLQPSAGRQSLKSISVLNHINIKDTDAEYVAKANILRNTVRNQLILHLIKNPFRWIFNLGLWSWLIARFFFLILNAQKIKNDPNKVYSGPIH